MHLEGITGTNVRENMSFLMVGTGQDAEGLTSESGPYTDGQMWNHPCKDWQLHLHSQCDDLSYMLMTAEKDAPEARRAMTCQHTT